MRVYLSGAIEYSPDHGRAWRAAITPFLAAAGHSVYDPALDARKNLTGHELEHFRSWKHSDLNRFQRTVRKIIQYDLDRIEQQTDCIICFWDEHCLRGAGTQAELTFAHRIGLTIYLVAGMPVSQISGWILGCATHVFAGFDELHAFLVRQSAPVGVAADRMDSE